LNDRNDHEAPLWPILSNFLTNFGATNPVTAPFALILLKHWPNNFRYPGMPL
jgi:hypothetical protein